jgi:hypothetical protein
VYLGKGRKLPLVPGGELFTLGGQLWKFNPQFEVGFLRSVLSKVLET